MRNIFFVFIILTASQLFGQSKRLWLKYGDDAFLRKDYTTAIDYYNKVLDDSTVMSELVLPYEVQIVNLKTKDFKKDTTKRSYNQPKKKFPNLIMSCINLLMHIV